MEDKKEQNEQTQKDYDTVLDEQTGKSYKLIPEKAWDVIAATCSILYLVIVLVIFTCLLFAVWSKQSFIQESNPNAAIYLLMIYAAIGGALGGVVNGIRSFIIWHAERQAFGRRYVWKYITQPLLGVVLAAIVYALIRSGFVVFGGGLPPADNFTNQALMAFAIGALAGYGCLKVFKWLDGHVNRLFKVISSVEIKVPDLKGKTQQEAKAALEEANLKLGGVSKEPDADPTVVDKVIRQNPPAGSMRAKGAAVDITIATGQ
jgi:hypothetical protein